MFNANTVDAIIAQQPQMSANEQSNGQVYDQDFSWITPNLIGRPYQNFFKCHIVFLIGHIFGNRFLNCLVSEMWHNKICKTDKQPLINISYSIAATATLLLLFKNYFYFNGDMNKILNISKIRNEYS